MGGGASLLVRDVKCLGFVTTILAAQRFFFWMWFFSPSSSAYLQNIEKFFDLFVNITFPGYTKFLYLLF